MQRQLILAYCIQYITFLACRKIWNFTPINQELVPYSHGEPQCAHENEMGCIRVRAARYGMAEKSYSGVAHCCCHVPMPANRNASLWAEDNVRSVGSNDASKVSQDFNRQSRSTYRISPGQTQMNSHETELALKFPVAATILSTADTVVPVTAGTPHHFRPSAFLIFTQVTQPFASKWYSV